MFNVKTVNQLYADVERDPFNQTFRQTLADYLIAGNDPRGQFILEQCKPDQDPELISRLLAEHGRAWAAFDLGIKEEDIPEGATFEFHKGFALWPLQVEYSNFQAAIDAGNYGDVDDYITVANFYLEDTSVKITANVVLYAQNRTLTSSRAIHEMRQLLGLHLETDQLWEMLAFGDKYPGIQCKFPVVSLGSVCMDVNDQRNVPYLDNQRAKRVLCLDYWDTVWDSYDHFLATRDWLIR